MKEKAKAFAINAHKKQVRKSDPEKPMVTHPIAVGKLLESFGYDDNVVAAGYLHDVVEDTEYTLEDIKKNFNEDIMNLVSGASEPDKSLSWEERKQHTINEVKNLPLRNKLVVCADKINNLEDLMIDFGKTGKRDFSAFKRGEKDQKWYFESVYQSLIINEDEDLPIFKRLKEVLDIVFDNKKDNLINDIFSDNKELLKKLELLHFKKQELIRMKELCDSSKPFVVEFCGTPRTGKTTILNNLYDFFKKGGFKIELIEELTTSKYYKEELYPKIKNMNIDKLNILIIEEARKQLLETINKDLDIILIDRSINDRLVWNFRRYKRGDMSKEKYNKITEEYSKTSKEIIDILVIGYTDAFTSLKRDYVGSLALEKRNFLNLDNIIEYNESMEASMPIFEKSVEKVLWVDTTNISPLESSLMITDELLSSIRKEYVKILNQKY